MTGKVWGNSARPGLRGASVVSHYAFFFAQIVFALALLWLISVFACILMCKVAPLVHVLTSETGLYRLLQFDD